MGWIHLRGVRHHLQRLGEGAEPPAVLLHGLLVDSLASWYLGAAPALADGRSVWMLDFRGHGRSERTRTGYGSAALAADVLALLDVAGLGQVDLVGHSHGARAALRLALERPERVRRLVLVEPPLDPAREDLLARWLGSDAEAFLADLPVFLRARLASGGRRGRRALERVRGLLEETRLAEEVRADPPLPDRGLASLQPPTLAILGTGSACRAGAERLVALAARARAEFLSGGHFLPLEAGPLLGASIRAFLDAP